VKPGERFPDLDLTDHTGRQRTLSEVAGGDPLALFTSRGWWCPRSSATCASLPDSRASSRWLRPHRRDQRRPAGGPGGVSSRAGRAACFTLHPDLTIHASYNGYWYLGRATMEELRQDLRAITRAIRSDWEVPAA
jgi:hypothetical protein